MTNLPSIDPTVVIRAARGSDGDVLEALARLDSQRPLTGEITVVEEDGIIVAAVAGERAVADPFRPTADLVALLRIHAARSLHVAPARPRVRVPRLRAA